MIKKLTNEEWMVTIEGWYEECFMEDKKKWELFRCFRNFFGKTKKELAEKLINRLRYQSFMFAMEKGEEEAIRRASNQEKLKEVILELIETPIE